MTKVLVSACLVGRPCRYNGRNELQAELVDALRKGGAEVVAFCPEQAGGLSTPRPPARLVGGDGDAVVDGRATVVTDGGDDVTRAFLEGAREAVARAAGCTVAYLKERSPSCGCACVHTDAGLVAGCGVTTALLRRAGIATISVA